MRWRSILHESAAQFHQILLPCNRLSNVDSDPNLLGDFRSALLVQSIDSTGAARFLSKSFAFLFFSLLLLQALLYLFAETRYTRRAKRSRRSDEVRE
jgi:hypothetical protein